MTKTTPDRRFTRHPGSSRDRPRRECKRAMSSRSEEERAKGCRAGAPVLQAPDLRRRNHDGHFAGHETYARDPFFSSGTFCAITAPTSPWARTAEVCLGTAPTRRSGHVAPPSQPRRQRGERERRHDPGRRDWH